MVSNSDSSRQELVHTDDCFNFYRIGKSVVYHQQEFPLKIRTETKITNEEINMNS